MTAVTEQNQFFNRIIHSIESSKTINYMKVIMGSANTLKLSKGISPQDEQIVDTISKVCEMAATEAMNNKKELNKYKLFSGTLLLFAVLCIGSFTYLLSRKNQEMVSVPSQDTYKEVVQPTDAYSDKFIPLSPTDRE